MARIAVLLGSINVGGNRLAMADLRAALEQAGFEAVETVAASGNVLFADPGRSGAEIESQLSDLLASSFGIACCAVVRTAPEIAAAVSDNPFAADGAENLVHTHFLERQASEAQFAQLVADHAGRGPERLALGDRALYIDFVDGAGNSKLTGAFMERRLGSRGTARNMRSLRRILEKMER